MPKYILLCLSIVLLSFSAFSQEHQPLQKEKKSCQCTIVPNNSIDKSTLDETIEKSINNYDWENFRLEDQKRVITFDNGYQVTLSSNQEITDPTVNSPVATNSSDLKNNHYKPTFDNYGNVMMLIPTTHTKEPKN